jgi:predicted hydrocarbon binding protein
MEGSMTEKQLGAGMFHVGDDDAILGFNRQWVIISVAMLANVFEHLIDQMGPDAKRRIYEAGFSSGKLTGDRTRERLGGGIEQVKQHVGLIGNMGWGRVKEFTHNEASGKIVIDFHKTWEAAGFGEVHPDEHKDLPTCTLCAGLFAGLATSALDKTYEAEETSCVAKGDASCRFELVPVS